MSLESVSLEVLIREAEKRYGPQWRIVRKRVCLGCGKKLSARRIRTHLCKIGYRKRIEGGFTDRRRRKERCGHGDNWKICPVCRGRMHKSDCTGVRDPDVDCCAARHEAMGIAV